VRTLTYLSTCLLATVAIAHSATVPRRSPELAMKTGGGEQLLLSSYRGKVVAILFILTDCPHCHTTVQVLSKLRQEYSARGFEVLCSAINDDAQQSLAGFRFRFHPPFPVGMNSRDTAAEYLQIPVGTQMLMPMLAFVDRAGNIREQHSGDDKIFEAASQEQNLRRIIESLVKPGASAMMKP